MEQPSRRIKLLSWLILGSFSVFFAEVVSGSQMFPYFTPWGIMAVMPLYALHILVLSRIVFNSGKPRFYSLFIAGAIFGMYEAYITKVLWDPTWAGAPIISIGGIAFIEMIILVLWWHPLMAFIIPLLVSENILTGSSGIVLPDRLKKSISSKKNIVLLFALLAGIFQSANSSSPAHSLLSGFSATAFLLFLIYIWKNKTRGKEFAFRQLLPSKKEFYVLSSLLMTLYVVMGVLLRPEALPGLFPQLIIWVIYGCLFVLLYLNMRKTRTKLSPENTILPFSWKKYIQFSLIFTFTSALFTAANIGGLIMVAFWVGGGITGVSLLYLSIRDSFA